MATKKKASRLRRDAGLGGLGEPRRMAAGVGLFEGGHGDVGVDRRRFQFAVAEHGLDVAHVASVFEEHRVAKQWRSM